MNREIVSLVSLPPQGAPLRYKRGGANPVVKKTRRSHNLSKCYGTLSMGLGRLQAVVVNVFSHLPRERLREIMILALLLCSSCIPGRGDLTGPMVPAEEFSQALENGKARDFSYYRAKMAHIEKEKEARILMHQEPRPETGAFSHAEEKTQEPAVSEVTAYLPPPAPPPGSSAPYSKGQMTSNASLWPDDTQGGSIFTDDRAFQAMDVITIVVEENTIGKKKAQTRADSEYTLLAGITNLFGLETKSWEANNTGLNPAQLINAQTKANYNGDAKTERSGSLTGRLSAVVLEVLPNGLLRIEGTKIVSINSEEEIMVLSGLVRTRDIDSLNQIISSRVANMRIDFYGQGVVGEKQTPGWGARLFEWVWPF